MTLLPLPAILVNELKSWATEWVSEWVRTQSEKCARRERHAHTKLTLAGKRRKAKNEDGKKMWATKYVIESVTPIHLISNVEGHSPRQGFQSNRDKLYFLFFCCLKRYRSFYDDGLCCSVSYTYCTLAIYSLYFCMIWMCELIKSILMHDLPYDRDNYEFNWLISAYTCI